MVAVVVYVKEGEVIVVVVELDGHDVVVVDENLSVCVCGYVGVN
jgi:hypothetical protein